MRKAGNGSTALVYLLGAAAFFLLFLFSCGIIALLYFGSSPPILAGPGGANNTPDGSLNGTGGIGPGGGIGLNTSETNISAKDMSLWTSINTDNVQQACLQKAKEEAGESADMVYSCTCRESAAAAEKSYECDIRTADPFTDYFANIRCALAARSCSVETNYGTANVSFDELSDFYAGG